MTGLAILLKRPVTFMASLSCRSPTPPNLNRARACLLNSYCTATGSTLVDDPTHTAESPELPSWVKFSERDDPVIGDTEDDFVLPSISSWIENHEIRGAKEERRGVSSGLPETDADKVSEILNNQFESPEFVVHALEGCDVDVSDSLVAQMLKRFGNNWVSAYGFFTWAKTQRGGEHRVDTYNLMVDCLGKAKKFDLMWETVERLNQLANGFVTLDTMAKVMRRHANAGMYEEAIDSFRRIEQYGVKQDLAALNTLMDALAKEGSVEHAHEIYLGFKDEIQPNLNTFNILLNGWSKIRQFERAQSTMEEMKEHGFCPNVVSYTCLVEEYCREKDFLNAVKVFNEMKENGCPPNIITYTILMHALGKGKQMNQALEIYDQMKQNGCLPDSSFCGSLIYVLSKAGRLKDAREVFDDMPKQGLARDALTYNTMIATACRHSQEENALKLLKEMEQDNVRPNIDTYAPLFKMCCRLKRMKVLSFLLSHMLKNDIRLDLGLYALLVRGLCKSGKLERACSFFEEAVANGYVPWDSMYVNLVKELDQKGMEKAKEQIEGLMHRAKEQGPNHSLREKHTLLSRWNGSGKAQCDISYTRCQTS